MIAKPIESVVEADLQQLIEAGTPESKRIEYKRALPEASDQGKVKFLKSVTALANTQGGDLIYGMDATDGIPRQLCAMEMASTDQVLQRLESLCADGVAPRLAGVQYRFVQLAAGGEVLVIRVAKSWNAPHRVTTGGHSHFYGRNPAGTYPLDVGELRQAFTLSESVAERIRAFRANRLLALGTGDAPAPLADGARIILHVVPLQSLTSDIRIDVTARTNEQLQVLQKFPPLGSNSYFGQRLNLDGRLTYSTAHDSKEWTYALLFRTGIIEAVEVCEIRGDEKYIASLAYERNIIEALQSYFTAFRELGVEAPAYIFLSLLGVVGYRFEVGNRRLGRDHYADRDALILPELQIEDWSVDPAEAMRPLFDMVWNAFGYERSFNYDQHGRWSGR